MIQTFIWRTISKLFPNYRDAVWNDGFQIGKNVTERDYEKQINLKLSKYSLNDFSSDELKLGYDYAVKVVKGEI